MTDFEDFCAQMAIELIVLPTAKPTYNGGITYQLIHCKVNIMIPELGHFCLVFALALAFIQALYPLWGVYRSKPIWIAEAKPVAAGQFLFLVLAMASLHNHLNRQAQQAIKTMESSKDIIARFKQFMLEHPHQAHGCYLLGKIYFGEGLYQEANDYFSRASILAPENLTYAFVKL